ncbi:MAG TPA: SRPBCC domain-containing protein [Polyangiaceae bacterium]
MKSIDVKVSRLIPGPANEVFDVWFDPNSPGGPWFGAKKAIMNLALDGIFYIGVERAGGILGHFGRFTAIDRPRAVEHTWMSEHTHGVETIVSITFEPRQGGTQMTIVHRGVPDDEQGRKHEDGWAFILSTIGMRFERKGP